MEPTEWDLQALAPEAFGGQQRYAAFRLRARARDAGGAGGAATEHFFFVDTKAPLLGFSAPPYTAEDAAVGADAPWLGVPHAYVHPAEATVASNEVAGPDDALPPLPTLRGTPFECRVSAECPILAVGHFGEAQHAGCPGAMAAGWPAVDVADEPVMELQGPWVPCSNATAGATVQWRQGLPAGRYALHVRATDRAGNGAEGAAARFVVRSAADAAAVLLRRRAFGPWVQLAFGAPSGVAAHGFRCRLQRVGGNGSEAWRPCSSPVVVRVGVDNVTAGLHVFEVTAVGPDGGAIGVPACGIEGPDCDAFELLEAQEEPLFTGAEGCGDSGETGAVLALVVGLMVLLGTAGGLMRYLRRAALVHDPLGLKRKSKTTRAFHNPAFGQDRPQSMGQRPSISAPSDFRHVQSGGMISGPTDFRHVAHGTAEGVTGMLDTGLGPVAPAPAAGAKLVKRVQVKQREKPTYPGANPNISAPTEFRHVASGAGGAAAISSPTDFRHVATGSHLSKFGAPNSAAPVESGVLAKAREKASSILMADILTKGKGKARGQGKGQDQDQGAAPSPFALTGAALARRAAADAEAAEGLEGVMQL